MQSTLLAKGGSLDSNQVSQLTFVAAVYNLTGSFLGLQKVTDQLQVRRRLHCANWQPVATCKVSDPFIASSMVLCRFLRLLYLCATGAQQLFG